MKKALAFVFSALLLLTAAVPDKTTTIFIIGDSTTIIDFSDQIIKDFIWNIIIFF